MINRVLIRRKVVQILYSYLLTRSDFKIEAAPETTSRDRRYAYTVYIRTLLMLLELSGYSTRPDSARPFVSASTTNSILHNSALAKALSTDDTLRSAILKGSSGIDKIAPALEDIYNKITDSAEYKAYSRRRNHDLAGDVDFWSFVISEFIASDAELMALSRKAGDDFTGRGYNNGIENAAKTLRNFSDNRALYGEALSALKMSLDKAYDLYQSLLMLPLLITRLEDERIEAGRNKFLPTDEDLNPNLRFVENQFVERLAANEYFEAYREKHSAGWSSDPMFIREMLDAIKQSEIYREYMEAPSTDLKRDCEFWREVFRQIILPSDALAEALESESVYWNDDLEIVGDFVLKTVRRFETAGDSIVMPMPQFKDDEDAKFGAELFDHVVSDRKELRSLIDRFINTDQWDAERLAFMDIIIMMTAIAEFLYYPQVPVPVTMNEYIEIANYYSGPKSGQFINGILYSVVNHLRQEGRLNK